MFLKKIKLLVAFLIIFISVLNINNISFSKTEKKDFFSRNIQISKNPQRILSLSPATTEILYSLGLDKKIVGVTLDCNYPPSASKKTKVGKFGYISLESVVSLKPDIIFGTKDTGKQLDILKNYKVPLIALDTSDINSILDNISIVGELTNTKSKALEVNKNLRNRIKIVKQNAKKINKPKIFYCVWANPFITAGKNSFINDMINIVGAKNISESINASFSQYSIESLVAENPDYIIIPKSSVKSINFKSMPWNRLKAVKNNHILIVNEDTYQRPSARIINALEELQKVLIKNQKITKK